MLVWFRESFGNSCIFLVKRGFYKAVSFTIQNSQQNTQSHFSVITMDPTYYENNDLALSSIATQDNCFENIFDPKNFPDRELIQYIHSLSFFWWNFFSILIMIFIIAIRCLHIASVDFFSLWRNFKDKTIMPHNRYLMHLMVLSSLEFAFLYHFHFQIFSFFYYVVL